MNHSLQGNSSNREIRYRRLLSAANHKVRDGLLKAGKSTQGCLDCYPTFQAYAMRSKISSALFNHLRIPRNFNKFIKFLNDNIPEGQSGSYSGKITKLRRGRAYLSHHLWDDLIDAELCEGEAEVLVGSMDNAMEHLNDKNLLGVVKWKIETGL